MDDPIVPTCFISHPWRSGRRKLAGHLFGLHLAKVLRDRGVQVWIDEVEMPPGTPIIPSVAGAIERQCDVFLFVLSADALNSANCMGELDIALRAEKPIIVLRRARCAIPSSLCDQIHLDVSARLLPRTVDRLLDGIRKLAREERVADLLADPDPNRRVEAASILATLQRPRGVRLIARQMDREPDDDVLHWFVRHLAELAAITPAEHSEVAGILHRFRDHPSPRVRQAVEDALVRLVVLGQPASPIPAHSHPP